MQTIYPDVLVCVNMFIDYCILLAVQKFLHIKKKQYRLIIGALTASLFSLIIFFPHINAALNFLIKASSAALIIFITFGKCSKLNYIKRVLTFLLISVCFSGIMTLIFLTLKPNGLTIKNDVAYFDISPLALVFLTAFCYLIFLTVTKIIDKKTAKSEIYKIQIIKNRTSMTFNGKIDTGCNLKEPFSGSPVIIAEKSLLDEKVLSEADYRIIPFSSLGGKGTLSAFKCDEIYINSKKSEKEIYIAVCENLITGEIKCLIGNNIV